jgi:diguanylate cyclase (GGDEF)-like protein
MFNRIPVLLSLIAAVIIALIGAYGVFLYSAASEADETQDQRNGLFINEMVAAHRTSVRKAAETLAVSDVVFNGIQNKDASSFAKELCDEQLDEKVFSSIGVMTLDGQSLFLCESGIVKKHTDHDYVFEVPRRVFRGAFEKFLDEQNAFRAVLPEFHFAELYEIVADRPYLIVAAISAPRTKRAMSANYQPAIVFGMASMRGVLGDTKQRLDLDELQMQQTATAGQNQSLVSIGGSNFGNSTAVTWSSTRSFRDQLLKAAPPIVLPSMSVLLLIGYFLTRIERLRVELTARENSMRHMALHDSLTGLPNRAYIQKLVEETIANSTEKNPNYLAVFDLDNFKSVNDNNGHDIGDLLLIEVAKRAVAALGPENTVARLGGDEFIAILKSARDDETALNRLDEMRKSIGRPVNFGSLQIHPNASIGAARIFTNSQSSSEVIKNADLALYEVKSQGKGHCRLFQG